MSRNLFASTPNFARRSRPPLARSTRTCGPAPSPPLSTSTPPAKPLLIESAMAMQEQAIAWRQAGEDIGFVPTMGALHAGHERLVTRARRENQRVIVSIFVNPTQFGPDEDFASYPRSFEADRARLEALGVDAIFNPSVDQIYPSSFKTRVDPGPLAELLEGKSRTARRSARATPTLGRRSGTWRLRSTMRWTERPMRSAPV